MQVCCCLLSKKNNKSGVGTRSELLKKDDD